MVHGCLRSFYVCKVVCMKAWTMVSMPASFILLCVVALLCSLLRAGEASWLDRLWGGLSTQKTVL